MSEEGGPGGRRGRRQGMRRAMGGALDATVGRVGATMGEAAMDVTQATAQQVIEDLEPYLIEEAVPRLVDGLTPYLAETVVPEILAAVHDHLVTTTVPEVVDGVTDHLIDVTVPRVLTGVTPALVEELLPRILEDLRPYLAAELVPQIVDALMPHLESEVAPQLIDALMVKIRDEVAPQLVDALMPKIRAEIVPTVMDDIIDDPRVRDLIREQSAGLFLDAMEALRENLADTDNMLEGFARRITRRQPRTEPAPSTAVVPLATGSQGQGMTLRMSRTSLAERRRQWGSTPLPEVPPGREFAHAGVVTRSIGLALDMLIIGVLSTQGLAAMLDLTESLLGSVPRGVATVLTGTAFGLLPLYFSVSWWFFGRTLGSWLLGNRVCTPDGLNPTFLRSLTRALLLSFLLPVWIVSGVISPFDPRRRHGLDRILHTEVRYVVPAIQQRRYLREAAQERAEQAQLAADAAAASSAATASEDTPEAPA